MKRPMSFVDRLRQPETLKTEMVDVEVYDGTRWVSLNDGHRYRLGAGTFRDTTQSRSRVTVKSSMFDGEWVTHTTKDNVTETIEVYIMAAHHSAVSELIEDLTEAFSQYIYNVRVSLGNHVETWRCFPADWSIARGQVEIHNTRATVRLNVPRFPQVTREVRQ